MAGYLSGDTRKVTTHRLIEMKERGEKISMLTSYDYTIAQIVDGAGVDVILVGDSASNVMAGNVTTLPITIDQMIYHGKSVMRGVKRALVVVDMPFGSYQADPFDGVRNAIRIMKETGADALKLEGGEEVIETITKIIGAGMPVMGHLGLVIDKNHDTTCTYIHDKRRHTDSEYIHDDVLFQLEAGTFEANIAFLIVEMIEHPYHTNEL